MKKKPPKIVGEATGKTRASSIDAVQQMTVAVLQDEDRVEPFTDWLGSLRDKEAKARILTRLNVARRGSLGMIRPVGKGVSELKIDTAPATGFISGAKRTPLLF